MTVRLEHGVIQLEGACPVEDAEMLLSVLQADPSRPIDISDCHSMHAAVLQVLLTYAAKLRGQPKDSFLRRWILPSLVAG